MDTTLELRRRRLFAGICMIAAPLVVGVTYLIAPRLSRDAVEYLTALAAAPGRAQTALVLGMFGIVLFAFVALGLAHLLREEQPWFGQLGAVLAITGLVLFAMGQGALLAAIESAQLDVASAAVVWDNVMSSPTMVAAIAGVVAAGIGFLALALGLVLARTAPLWTSYGLGLGTIVLVVGILASSTVWAVAAAAVLFLALVPLGYELIAEPDAAWDHPAHFEGFHPVTG